MFVWTDARRARPLWVWLVLVTGCFDQHPCFPEICDGQDNDCDDLVDEGFADTDGRYTSIEHCGGCGMSCVEALPSAETTACVVRKDTPRCRIDTCPEGYALVAEDKCMPKIPVLCLPCSSDEECSERVAGSQCVTEADGSGRCASPCESELDCPVGYACEMGDDGSRCRPNGGSCLCSDVAPGTELSCELRGEGGHLCPGTRSCDGGKLGACQPLLEERCNAQDDDCDGVTDEDFRDAQGRFSTLEHCGACARRCAAPGPHTIAQCIAEQDGARCRHDCEEGWVDVDGVAANGCECRLTSGPDVVVSGDGDCDGEVDPLPRVVFVSPAGNDANAGIDPSAPVATLARGIAVALSLARPVLVARGIYEGPLVIAPGLTLIGGYSPDFSAHDELLYPVHVERKHTHDGTPLLRCSGVTVSSHIQGLTLLARDAADPGQGNSAVLLDGCGPSVVLRDVTVLAARGQAGADGLDSSDVLGDLGASSLSDLNGNPGQVGTPGSYFGQPCGVIAAGSGGNLSCGTLDVSGGDGGDAQCAVLDCDNQSSAACGNAGCTDYTVGDVCAIEAAKAAATPNPPAEDGQGVLPGLAGEQTYDAPTNRGICSFCDDNPSLLRNGQDGGDGAHGAHGEAGASCSGEITLDAQGRVHGAHGQDGGSGTHGSGGGGGSAGGGYTVIANTVGDCGSVPGGSGGGGGSGGCGAPGARGGAGGGGSVGVVIRLGATQDAGPTLQGVRVVSSSGGDGGHGGIGARGGAGGPGGFGGVGSYWCARAGGRGGDGGNGGNAGGGGGGCGGPSIGVLVIPGGVDASAYATTLSTSVQIQVAGTGGSAGQGGFSPTQPGKKGLSGNTHTLLLTPL